MKFRLTVICSSFALSLPLAHATVPSQYANQPLAWFQGQEGRRIADNVITWQSPQGSWPKNSDTASRSFEGERDKLNGTFDNGATISELRFLAQAIRATDEMRYRQAFLQGVDHVLEAQYPTGGWPQRHPSGGGYHRHITFNDNTMVRILEFLREVTESPNDTLLDKGHHAAANAAFKKGIQCILDCQIVVDGTRTVWCAQHDEVDLQPRPARSYELGSLSGAESAGILRLLMSLENPSQAVQRAVHSGVAWYESAKITGIRIERAGRDRVIVEDPNAPPIWARFYELETDRPFFCGRDGIKKYRLSEIEAERRSGYSWYGNWPASLLAKDYPRWRMKHPLP